MTTEHASGAAMRERLRRALPRRAVVHGLLAGLATGLACWLAGVQGARPALIGLCVAAAVTALTRVPASWYGPWPARPERPPGGGSSQVWRLANRLRSLHAEASASDPALQYRLRRLATARLRRLGLEWSDPRAVRALGPDVHAALQADTFAADLHTLDRVVTAIEQLRTVGQDHTAEHGRHNVEPGGTEP
ncbi:hypothetical protein [Jiangella asiatica]|uniref:Uncharacterized protein n=1 Tax=Jiangella asiatica TaxID=2530372 RepID=A0A4R5CPR9_9ACTN|nr:hypothetical protein [Jiangella asiatica]TDE00791.1 hypothetical protein E1269_24635 [Jiangella asiatica]